MDTSSGIHPWVAENSRRVGFSVLMAIDDWGRARETAQVAEELGFDAVWLPDHPLMGWDSWTALAGLAEVTRRVRLGTQVTCAGFRNPVLLARIVADVDRHSGGRVVLGLGSGDTPWEWEQMGLRFAPAERTEMLAEVLQIVPALLRGEEVRFEGRMFQIRGARLRPAAAQQPHVPIVVAGGARRTLRLAAQYADASNLAAASWAGGAYTADDARAKLRVLDEHVEAAGRSAESILRTTEIGLFLADSDAEAAALREGAERDPALAPLLNFLQGIPSFGTPERAVDRIRGLVAAGFHYITCAALDPRMLPRLAEEVVRPFQEGRERAAAGPGEAALP
jgi:alkanesulfonate monooxygenase SsuD/methylene tetrahydromethanopterin reductase-like flavin-dependent oxidoreductase (luciferase family)